MKSNSTRPLLVILASFLLVLGLTVSTNAGTTSVQTSPTPASYFMSTRSRGEVVTKIANYLVTKTGNKPSAQKYHDGKEIPNIVVYEALFSTKARHITVQYFPGGEGQSAPSITFFVTERNPANRWSISVNMDGSLSTATGDNKGMILSVGAGKENLNYWMLKGDPMVDSVLAWQEKK